MTQDDLSLPPRASARVDELAYATAPNHHRYRVLMRFFYLEHLKLHGWLAPRDIFVRVKRHLGPEYTEQDCERDLEVLRGWGNLFAEQDQARARSLEDFYRSRYVYHISKFSVELEALLAKHEAEHGTSGSLNATLLDRLWFRLEHLQRTLEGALPTPLTPEFLRRDVQGPWAEVLAAFTDLRDNAVAYHHTLSTARPMGAAQADAFRIYKDTLLKHLKGFIDQLQFYSPKIRTLLTRWEASETRGLLLTLLTEHDRVHDVSRLGADSSVLTVLQIREQVHEPGYTAIREWFALGGGCEFLYTATGNAILQIVRENERLATRHLIGVSRRRDLERLARAFAAVEDPVHAHRLAARAFGAALPRHLRGATGATQVMTDRASVWRQSPQEHPLRVIRRGRPSTASVASVQTNYAQLERMRLEAEARLTRERELWDHLFRQPTLPLAGLRLADPVLRTRLLDVIGKCLVDPDHEALASDGRRIRLTMPAEGSADAELIAPDGTFVGPAFTLTVLADDAEREAAPNRAFVRTAALAPTVTHVVEVDSTEAPASVTAADASMLGSRSEVA